MGFFDKVKNMFTEEVEDEVKVEKIQKEVTHVTIDSPKNNDFREDEFNLMDDLDIEKELTKPVFFDDNDFKDLNLEFEDKIHEKNLYNNKIETIKEEVKPEKTEEKKLFRPTPIISPVYGVLDKNYHKEDIVSRSEYNKNENNQVSSIDTIRNKAYGTLEDELENTLFGNNSILFKQAKEKSEELENLNEDALSTLTDDIGKELDELLTKKEKYLDKDIKDEVNEDLLDFIDSTLYKEGDGE